MGYGNKYWTATEKASIQQSQITARWAQPGVPYCLVAVDCLNFAFDVFYTAKTSIQQCDDAEQRSGMLHELQDAATAGWGSGVQDLDDAFEHLIANNGGWTDNNTANYYGGGNKIFRPANNILEAPAAATHFLAAVDEKLVVLRDAIVQFNTQSAQLAQAADASDLRRATSILKDIKSYGGKAKYLLWWAPRAQTIAGQSSSFAGILAEFTQAADLYDRGLQAGLNSNAAASLAALRAAMRFVPVLGSMYGQIVDGIPNLMIWFQDLNREYFRRIDAAANAH